MYFIANSIILYLWNEEEADPAPMKKQIYIIIGIVFCGLPVIMWSLIKEIKARKNEN
jgi:hypothetical protein|tara:strand:+ start:2117 stop:2287 length:171 start_codon:yes stop_codon:yes gene_type:complete